MSTRNPKNITGLMKHFAARAAVIITAILVSACSSMMTPKENSRCNDFRAEGLSLGEALPSSIKYVRKYFSLNWCAPDSLKEHFATQTGWLKCLSNAVHQGDETVSIAFVGDIMWIRNGWDRFADERLTESLSSFDMVFGNLETPIDTLSGVPSLLPDYARYNARPGLRARAISARRAAREAGRLESIFRLTF